MSPDNLSGDDVAALVHQARLDQATETGDGTTAAVRAVRSLGLDVLLEP